MAGFVAVGALQVPRDVDRGWLAKWAWQGFPIGRRMNSPDRDAASVADHSWRGTSWRAARLRAGQERLDANHLASAALRAVAQRLASQPLVLIQIVNWLIDGRRRRRCLKQLAALRQLDLAVAVGQQPIVPNALESCWQDVQQEATHELGCLQAHDLGLRLLTVVLPLEVDVTVGKVQQPVV